MISAILLDIWNKVLELIGQEASNSNQARDADRDEAETCFSKAEAADWWVDDTAPAFVVVLHVVNLSRLKKFTCYYVLVYDT